MAGTFEIYQSGDGFRWRLKASNGQNVAQGEAYHSKSAAKAGTEAVQRAAAGAKLVDTTEGD